MGEEETESQWLDTDELEVVRALLEAGVRFLIVGGRAVQFHGYARPAKDLDLLVETLCRKLAEAEDSFTAS